MPVGGFPEPGSLEAMASGHALDGLAQEAAKAHPDSALGRIRAAGRAVTGVDVVDAAHAGDATAISTVELWAERVGIGVANAINTFDPDEVVIGGGAARAGELLLRAATRIARAYVLPGLGTRTTIRLARFGPRAGVLGAAMLALQELELDPHRRIAPSNTDPGGLPTVIVACGFDHAGVPLRPRLLELIEALGHEVLDMGTDSTDPIDYPLKALQLGQAVASGRAERGVIVCGSGAGVSVAACKIQGVYAATIHDTYTAHQAVEHDGVNVICLGGRVIGVEVAAEIVTAFVGAEVSDEERHVRRRGEVLEIERTGGQ